MELMATCTAPIRPSWRFLKSFEPCDTEDTILLCASTTARYLRFVRFTVEGCEPRAPTRASLPWASEP